MLEKIDRWFAKREISRLKEVLSCETDKLKRREIEMQIKMCETLWYRDYRLFFKE